MSGDVGIEFGAKPRSSLAGDRNTHRKHVSRAHMRGNHESPTRREFFVPSFAIRRAVFKTPELQDFHNALTSYFAGRTYQVSPVDRMALTIVEQKRFRDTFIAADVQPLIGDVRDTALIIKDGMKSVLKSKPHRLSVPVGPAHAFGSDNKKIGLVPSGWRGFRARYPRKVEEGKFGANAQLVLESNLALGAISNIFVDGIDGQGRVSDIDLSLLRAVTPHITIGQKIGERAIGNNERAELNGEISYLASETCPEIELFDPVIHLRLENGHRDRWAPDTTSPYPTTIFMRRPKFNEFGHQLPESLTTLS